MKLFHAFILYIFFDPTGSDDESITSEKDEKIKLMMSEEEQRIADMGKPMLGEIRILEVKIHESTEFKVRLIKECLSMWMR